MPFTFLEAAERILGAAGEPLSARELTDRALAQQMIQTQGATPWATMEAQLAVSVRDEGDNGKFVRVAPRTYALRCWIDEGRITVPVMPQGGSVRVPHYPLYSEVRTLLPILHGVQRAAMLGMRGAIWEHRGTVEENVDWTDPDQWIPERLKDGPQDMALRIWQGSNRTVNPRHLTGHWLLANQYELINTEADGRLTITPSGTRFVQEPDGEIVQQLDDAEGLIQLLSLLTERGPSTPAELLEPWLAFLLRVSNVRAETTARSFLYQRLRNLAERGLVSRSGTRYEITGLGVKYAGALGPGRRPATEPGHTERLHSIVTEQRSATREELRARLSTMDPYAFEYLVKRLLEEMGYVEVEVTSRSGDRGVDIVGRIALGITEVREVVQVKRQGGNVQRPVLDQLRGSLHRFDAVRGTIISLGRFGPGIRDAAVERGAAPITLIDGEKLLELLIEHGIGVRKKIVESLELDISALESAAAIERVDGEDE